MPEDIRVQLGFFAHPKTIKLQRRLGDSAVVSFLRLWAFCAGNEGRQTGDLAGLSDEDIEIAAGWGGENGVFVSALAEVSYLDGECGVRVIHDFEEHQPWVATKSSRSHSARTASLIRWHKLGRHAQSVDGCPQCDASDPHMRPHTDAYATHSGRINPQSEPVSPISNSISISNTNTPASASHNARRQDLVAPEALAVIHYHQEKHPSESIASETPTTLHRVMARLAEGHTVEQLKQAVDGNAASDWHQRQGLKGLAWICESAERVAKCIAQLDASKDERNPDAWDPYNPGYHRDFKDYDEEDDNEG